jgi:hypothetical protein
MSAVISMISDLSSIFISAGLALIQSGRSKSCAGWRLHIELPDAGQCQSLS